MTKIASGPSAAVIRQGLMEEIARRKRLHYPTGDLASVVQSLTPADFEILSKVAAAQEAARAAAPDPNALPPVSDELLRGLSQPGMRAVMLVLAHEANAAHEARDRAAHAARATIQGGGAALADKNNYGTEDNWIASSITHELADMAFLIVHPGQRVPDLPVMAKVDPSRPSVQVEIEGWETGAGDRLSADLTPAFAWDGRGYAALAQQLLGNTSGAPSSAPSLSSDPVTCLLDLTGSEIASEDVLISKQLRQEPASTSAHEAAALTLVALALRENAGEYDDSRMLLNRATAHLALARALRGEQETETWAGLLAGAGVLTLAGRETDALAALDALNARADCPDAAKTWITGLRMLNKEDWRVADIQADSPLLLKILWFRMAAHDLPDLVATRHLDMILSSDVSDAENNVPDWGRAVVAPTYRLSVENGERFGQANMPKEFSELKSELEIEGASAMDFHNLGSAFSEAHFRSDDPQLPELLVTVYKGRVNEVSGGAEETEGPSYVFRKNTERSWIEWILELFGV